MANSLSNMEIIQIAESVAREKGIDKKSIIAAMEQAIQAASKKKYGVDNKIIAKINPDNGEIKIHREREVVEEIVNVGKEITLTDAKQIKPDAKLGDLIQESLPNIDLARVAAQSAKQVIIQKVKEAEREKQYEEFKDKVGEIINGVIKRVEFGNVIIDLGRGEGLLRRDNIISGETFKVNDRVRAYIEEVKKDTRGSQIVLSRVHDDFLAKLFAQEVPEVYDKVIEVKAVAREPGSKAKVAVFTNDLGIDPVGSCVGVRGSRIQAIINELHGEKIDIVRWSSDPAKYVINALTPATVSKVIIDEDSGKIEVVVPNDQLSAAIGRKGQNVRLASKITGWNIDILTEDEESKRRADEFTQSSGLFMTKLGLEEVLAQLLAAEGFNSIEDVAYSTAKELSAIDGIDENLAKELISRAEKILAEQDKEISKEIDKLGVEEKFLKVLTSLVTMDKILILAEAGIKTFEDLAELSVEEFKGILPNSELDDVYIKNLISKANSMQAEE